MKKVLLSVLIVMTLFIFAGCGSKNELEGTWKNPKDDTMNTVWVFSDDEKCEMKNDYYTSKGTYKINDNKVTIDLDGWINPKVYKYEVKNDKLTLKATDTTNPSYEGMTKSK